MSLLDSLLVSVFGMAVVFVVLVFLNLLVRLQSALVAGAEKKKSAGNAAAAGPEAAEAPAKANEKAPAAAASEAAPAAADEPTAGGTDKDAPGAAPVRSGGCSGTPRKYTASVGGRKYDVLVEELDRLPRRAAHALQAAPPAEKRAPAPAAAPAPVPAAQAAPTDEGVITAPIPGVVLEVKTAVGARVGRGETLLLLEAMKMENEVVADRDGLVTQIFAAKGASVDIGAPLVALR